MNFKSGSPSFSVWLFVIVFASAGLLYFHFNFMAKEHYIFNDFMTKKISTAFSNNKSGKRKVIVVGNSLTHCALPYKIQEENISFDYFRIYHGGVSLKSFMPVLEHLIQYEPDYIVIQSDLFMFGLDIKEKKSDVIKYLVYSENAALNSISFVRDNSELDEMTVFKNPLEKVQLDKHIKSILYTSKLRPEIVSAFNLYLDKIKGKNIQIILLDLPRFKEVEDSLRTYSAIKENQNFIEEISKSSQVTHLSVLDDLPDSLYQDHSHFNKAGREVFTSAFINQIDSLVRFNL